jgi:acetyl esterase/lipase
VPEPQALRAALERIGRDYTRDIAAHSEQVKQLYAPLLAAADKRGIDVARDLAYGAHARQVLDVFRPAGARHADVVVFVHGGAFVRGAKSGPYGIYDNVLYWFARQGLVGVNLEYRLAPEAPYPQGALDVAAALEWVHANIAEHGGDPQRILLVGHSAGGTHAAAYVMDPAVERTLRPIGLVLVSARLRADVSPLNPNAAAVRAYCGDDDAALPARSPVTHAERCALPTMVVVAEHENPLLDVYGLEFAYRLAAARGRAPRFLQCRGHNHMSVMAHFGSGDEELGREILAFWARVE